VLYILIQVVCIGTLPALADSRRPLVDAGRLFLGGAGAAIITAGVVVSIIGNLNVLVLAGSRLPFAMAGERELPRPLATTHPRFRTPHVAILLTASVMLGLTLTGSFIYALTISTIARLLGYMATCAALPVLRLREASQRVGPASFRAPAGTFVAATALLLAFWLLTNSTWREARDAGLAAAAGLLIYAVYKGVRAHEGAIT
jgi:amino acid transporter